LVQSEQEVSISDIKESFGENAQFKNCQEVLFTLDELLSFLSTRGKVILTETGVSVIKENICNN